jgi:hypothetical protein
MEAATWTANHCAELIAADKLGKTISLNEDFNPDRGLMPYIKPAMRYGPPLLGALAAWKIARRLIRAGKA